MKFEVHKIIFIISLRIFFLYKKFSVRRGEGVRLKLSLKFTVLHPTLQIGNEIKKLAIEFFHEMKRMMRVWVEIVEPYHFSVTNFQALFYTKPFTMLQKLSKCEVKAWLCWYLIISPPLRIHVKSNIGEFKRSKNVIFGNFRDSELWIL